MHITQHSPNSMSALYTLAALFWHDTGEAQRTAVSQIQDEAKGLNAVQIPMISALWT